MATKPLVKGLWEPNGIRIKVRVDKGSNRRKVEPLSWQLFFLVHTEVLMPQTSQTYQWKAYPEWGRIE
jgi:hypothetical protein